MPEHVLNLWRFDTPDWLIHPRLAPILNQNIRIAESWSGYALAIGGLPPARLVFPLTAPSGRPNLDPVIGTLRFWFRPDWTSAGLGGQGPGSPARLLEIGTWSGPNAAASWSLQLDPDGSRLALVYRNGPLPPLELLAAPTPWVAGQWHQIVLSYSPEQTRLYMDGIVRAAGPGAELSAPNHFKGVAGFALGSDVFGGHLAQGQFDELTTFAAPLGDGYIASYYDKFKATAALGPVSPQEQSAFKALVQDGFEKSLSQPQPPPAALSGGLPLDCDETALCIEHVPGITSTELQLSILGGKPWVQYDLLALNDLNLAQDWGQWTKIGQMDFDDVVTVYPTGVGSPDKRFYRLAEVVDPLNLGPVTFYVSPFGVAGADGSRDLPFSSLGAALASPNVPDCAVIQVLPGVYSGANNRNLNFGDRHLVLVSERGWEQTIIDCGGGTGSRAFTFDVTNNTTRGYVIGFSIINATDSAVIISNGSNPLFANCAFRQNTAVAGGGAIVCVNSEALFVNCRFYANTANSEGGGIEAIGLSSRVRLSHCTFSENVRANNGGTLMAANGATIELINSIVWSTFTGLGAEIQTGGSGGTVVASYSNVRGGFAGTGNIDFDPLFEAGGTLRLAVNSLCIDQGTTDTFPGCGELARYDMDGEARLDHAAFANAISTVDIGADEYVYRLQPLLEDGLSQVDEASGVVYLGSIGVGNETRPKFAVVDDEVTTLLYIYELNAAGSQILNTTAVNISHPSPPGSSDVSNEDITDLEDITFDSSPNRRHLYIATSLTKRNRYRDVDHIASDPLIDPPSSDYDRRRTIVMRLQLDANFNPLPSATAPTKEVWESENAVVPDRGLPVGSLYNTGYNANAGLIAYIRNQLDVPNSRYRQLSIASGVMIAWNTVNKFGAPVNGVSYTGGQQLPYGSGGPSVMAGTVLGNFAAAGSTTHTALQNGQQYFYRVWAFDANNNYYPLSMRGEAVNNGIPKIMINEFEVAGGNERIELYNPAPVQVNISGFGLSDDSALPFRWTVPAGTFIPGRGLYFNNSFHSPGIFSFIDSGDEDMFLTPPGPNEPVDRWNMKDPDNLDSEGRAWDGGPRGADFGVPATGSFGSCRFFVLTPASPFPPTFSPVTSNDTNPRRTFDVVPAVPAVGQQPNAVHLVWASVGLVPAAWAYTPKQHDNHSINLEGFGYRSQTEMIVGLRSPLSGGLTESTPYFAHKNRVDGKALYFRVNNVTQFLPPGGGWTGAAQGITGPFELDLKGQGIRCIQWCDQLAGGAGRYLIIGGPANGGPLEKETFGETFSLYSWTGVGTQAPQELIADLRHYTIRPEGVHLIEVGGATRVMFAEDRFKATGYATRNLVHWPLSILGTVQ